MPTFEITSPDGAVYHVDGPEGATEEQAMQQVMAQHQQPQGFGARLGQDLQNRQQQGQQILKSDISGPSKVIQYVGKVGGGLANDAIGEATPEILKKISGGAVDLADKALQYAPGYQAYGKAVGNTVNAGSGAWNNFSQAHPEIAGDISAVGEVGKLAGNLASIKGGTNAVRGGLNAASDALVNRAQSRAVANISPASQSLTLAEQAARDKAAASTGYNGQADIAFSDPQLQSLKSNLSSMIPKRDAALRAWNNTAASGHVNDLLQSMETEPLTFDGALAQRSAINDSWSAASRAGKSAEASQLSQVKDALDKTMINPETGSWQSANRQFGIASTKQDFSDMVDSALDKAQPANSLDTAVGRYLNSWRGKTLTDSERNILEQLTKNTFTKELKRNIAGRLTSAVASGVGASVGGVPGAVAGDLIGTFASKLARDSAMADKVAGLQEFFDAMDKRPMPSIPASAPTPPPLQLTGPGAVQTVDSLGNVSRTPNPAHEIVTPQTRPITGASGGQSLYDLQNPPQPQALRLPAPGKMSALPPSGAEIAQMNAEARLRNAARGNTEQPLMSGETIQMRPPNQMTIGAKGNLGTQLILKAKEMAAQGKSPLEIDQFIRTTLKNRQVK